VLLRGEVGEAVSAALYLAAAAAAPSRTLAESSARQFNSKQPELTLQIHCDIVP
jgi:hypothetical protein